ncbi:transcription initiation factor TFIID subunit 11-like isoform X3 [Olea europaea var. sylvestris]|uniref:transcription initiation factor TFIID subunit 11-like isoform X3 n=1 Tax=Olea europaea var. sylvestris TaxID=158386 RepID=UPI000C1CE301|nr:transcription initiation factor TFIID subunit 11-like isoform X3 [Olea europaea var. sylvestris]
MQLGTGFPMKKSKDPFEVAFEEQDVSPPESPTGPDENEEKTRDPSTSAAASNSVVTAGPVGKSKEEDEEEEEENMDVELGKFPSSGDPDKVAIMQSILSQFTEEQMSRYESFRRSGFQKSNMKRLLTSITGSAKISMPMTIVVSGIAKMFVGELVETARIVMADRGESGPIRPCHMREAYRRLKLEGKIPKRSVPRLFC